MAQIVTITNPLTGQPAQVDQLEHTAQQTDDAIARALPGGTIDITLQNKLGGIESTEYPGCYYRMVDGVVEWFNPPMQVGGIDADGNPINEYRTTERYLGKPVYTKAVDCGAWANGKTVKWNEDNAVRPISYTACNNGSALPYGDSTTYIKIVDMTSIHLGGTTDPWGGPIVVIIKYYKTTD